MILAANPALYVLNERDRQTLLIEPFFGKRVCSLAIGSKSAFEEIEIPRDRICLVQNLQAQGTGTATDYWFQLTAAWRPNNASTADQLPFAERYSTNGLVPDNAESAASLAKGGTWNMIDRHLQLPPGGIVRFTARREGGATIAGSCTFTYMCHLIPAGNVGRVS